jgi:exopolyphosphatase / guanosine-5'-triphosphate,3'-diphosphate pyrophosphatase
VQAATQPYRVNRTGAPRAAVVDLGSNSVRLVVYETHGGLPVTIFNEKAVLRLGRGLHSTGRLNEEGVAQAMGVMARFNAVARGLEAQPFEVLATAAVRDATNGPDFVAALQARMPEVPIRILSGDEEAAYGSAGLLSGLPEADGVMADIGGGSLELVRLVDGVRHEAVSLPLGVIRLADRAGGDVAQARLIAQAELEAVDWLDGVSGRDLYLVGGAFRALARIQIARTGYPLNIIHHYTITREDARELCGTIAGSPRKALERIPGAPRRRLDDLPFAATVLRRLLRRAAPRRVVFCANGLREGWFAHRVMGGISRDTHPMLAVARDMATTYGRNPALPPALIDWTAQLYAHESAAGALKRESACWLSDIGSHDHPEYRAEQTFLRVLHQPGAALDHPTRAWLAFVLATRHEAEPDQPFLYPARRLLDPVRLRQAETLGLTLRLAYSLCAGTPELLAGTSLQRRGDRLILTLAQGKDVFVSDSVARRLDRLAEAMGVTAEIVNLTATAA